MSVSMLNGFFLYRDLLNNTETLNKLNYRQFRKENLVNPEQFVQTQQISKQNPI